MSILVIRHGLSEANNYENIGTPTFGSPDAELMQLGIEQARTIPSKLLALRALNDSIEPVATSELRRARQTATEAGLHYQTAYSLLNEIEPSTIGLERSDIKVIIESGKLPGQILHEAERTLQAPPSERVWFSHGLRIAGLCIVLGQHQDKSLIPKFCEIREITL